jgi:hypothetical protein
MASLYIYDTSFLIFVFSVECSSSLLENTVTVEFALVANGCIRKILESQIQICGHNDGTINIGSC